MEIQFLVRKCNNWAYRSKYSPIRSLRMRRMKAFLRLVRPPSGAKIVDLGGTSFVWDLIDHDFDVTLVNMPGTEPSSHQSRYQVVHGDACNLAGSFGDRAFDIVFSNSVIEHVGDEARQEAFGREVLPLADAHWIQTPNPEFPIEAHTGVWGYWRRSAEDRERLLARWATVLPGWTEMIRETRAVPVERLRAVFPSSEVYAERVCGLAKPYAAYRPYGALGASSAGS